MTCLAYAIAVCSFSIRYNFDDLTNSSEITTYLYSLLGIFLFLNTLSCCAYFLPSAPLVGFLQRSAWLFLSGESSPLDLKIDRSRFELPQRSAYWLFCRTWIIAFALWSLIKLETILFLWGFRNHRTLYIYYCYKIGCFIYKIKTSCKWVFHYIVQYTN